MSRPRKANPKDGIPQWALDRMHETRWKRRLLRWAARLMPAGDEPLPRLGDLHRVLLVAVNHRLGNTVVATAGVAALLEALPGAEVDFLGGTAAQPVLEGYPLRRVIGLPRSEIYHPLRLLRLVRDLRRQRYDAAIHVSTATVSVGALLMFLSGARHRVGASRPEGNLFFRSTVTPPWGGHKVDRMRSYLELLGVKTARERTVLLHERETRWAQEHLAAALGAEHPPAIGLFVGGRKRKGKDFGAEMFGAIARGVRDAGYEPLVFLGPEEKSREARIRAALGNALFVEEPNLRRVAALLSRCRAVVAPDSGPMHLSIAVGTPTLALFRKQNFHRWGPRPPHGEVVFDPTGDDADAALAGLWRLLGDEKG